MTLVPVSWSSIVKAICRAFVMTAVWATVAAQAATTRVITPLPVYPPAVEVIDRHGNSLTPRIKPRLEFATLLLHEQPSFRPIDERQAACELSAMVPDDFEARLLDSRCA